LGIEYTPSLVFFAPSGRKIFRTEGYLESFHIQGSLDYVSSGAYLRQPSFQRYLAARRAALKAREFEVELMDRCVECRRVFSWAQQRGNTAVYPCLARLL